MNTKTRLLRNAISIALFITAAFVGCTSDSSDEPATRTPILPGEINIGNSPDTRVNITSAAPSWQDGDELAVTDPNGKVNHYVYRSRQWEYSHGQVNWYMEDFSPGATFPAEHPPTGPEANQSTLERYLAQTHLAGSLTLNGRYLETTENNPLRHQTVDIVITLAMGQGWDSFATFSAGVENVYIHDNNSADILPYRLDNSADQTITCRAQLPASRLPGAGTGQLFSFTYKGKSFSGSYTLPAGAPALTNGQRLNLGNVYFHATGILENPGTVTVFDFVPENMPPITVDKQ